MPYQGAANSMDRQSTILPAEGPLTITARPVKLLFQAVLCQQLWYHDPQVLEHAWREEVEQETFAMIQEHSQ